MNPSLSLGSEFHDEKQTLELTAEEFPVVLGLLTNTELISAKAPFADTAETEYKNLNYFMERSLDNLIYITQEPVRKSASDQALRQKQYVRKMKDEYRTLYATAYMNALKTKDSLDTGNQAKENKKIIERNENLLSSLRLGISNGWPVIDERRLDSTFISMFNAFVHERNHIGSNLITGFIGQKVSLENMLSIGSLHILCNQAFKNFKDRSSEIVSQILITSLKDRIKIQSLTTIFQVFTNEVPFLLAHLLTKDAPVKIKSHQVSYFLRSCPQSAYDFYSLAISKYQEGEISLEDLTQLAEPGKTNVFQGISTAENLVDRSTIDWNMYHAFDKALKELTTSEDLADIKNTLETKSEQNQFDRGTVSLDLIMDSIIENR